MNNQYNWHQNGYVKQYHNYTKTCPKCESTNIKYGKQDGYAVVQGKGLFSTSRIHLYICGRCGYVVDQFVDRPDKMKDIELY